MLCVTNRLHLSDGQLGVVLQVDCVGIDGSCFPKLGHCRGRLRYDFFGRRERLCSLFPTLTGLDLLETTAKLAPPPAGQENEARIADYRSAAGVSH